MSVKQSAEPAGMSMQSALGRPAASGRRAGICSQSGRVGALLLSFAASACANVGQIGNLTEERRIAVAVESVDGPPPAVFRKFVSILKEEAGTHQITVVPSGAASYRLRGYLATHVESGGTAVTWAWDIYDADQRRALRLDGAERSEASERTRWAGADDQVLRKIARTGIAQFTAFMASGRPSRTAAAAPAPPPRPEQKRSTFAWLDDWAPEASGIFRIFRSESSRPEDAKLHTALDQSHVRDIPLPRGRPAPSGAPPAPSETSPESTLAYALSER